MKYIKLLLKKIIENDSSAYKIAALGVTFHILLTFIVMIVGGNLVARGFIISSSILFFISIIFPFISVFGIIIAIYRIRNNNRSKIVIIGLILNILWISFYLFFLLVIIPFISQF